MSYIHLTVMRGKYDSYIHVTVMRGKYAFSNIHQTVMRGNYDSAYSRNRIMRCKSMIHIDSS